MKVDVLAVAAHPDDVELTCGGTVAKLVKQGRKVAVVDLTRGELGTRGTPEIRKKEAEKSTQILGLAARENLGMADGFFEDKPENQLKVIQKIRKYRPDVVFANALRDRHIDHGRAARLTANACFLSGLRKIETEDEDGTRQEAWRPRIVMHYIQDYYLEPDVIVDVSETWETKIEAVKAFSSQFYDPHSREPETPISGKEFFGYLEARAQQFGRLIKAKYGEGFQVERPVGIKDITQLL